jgi:hypothetical protein
MPMGNLARRSAVSAAVVALLIALTTAGIRAVGSRSAIEPSADDSALTASGSTSFATGGEPLRNSRYKVGGVLAKPRHGSFRVAVGSVVGLYPGNRQRLPLRLSNPLPYPIRIQTATTTATGPHGCPPDTSLLLRTRTFHRLVIGTNRSQSKTLRFGMLKTATDACQNGMFTVTVSVTAVRA